MCGAPAAVSVR